MMLKRRIALGLTLNDGVLFRTKRFEADYRYTSNFVTDMADEVAVIDVTPVRERREGWRERFGEACRDFTARLQAPMTVSCSIANEEDCKRAFNEWGADKLLIGPPADWRFVEWMAETYGQQAVVMGVTIEPGAGERLRTLDGAAAFVDYVQACWRWGAGEFLLSDVERDGSLQGYNLEALELMVQASEAPVMVQGGCGSWEHMRQAFAAGADAAVTNNIFHFTDAAMNAARSYLLAKGVPVRKPVKVAIPGVA